MLGPAVQRFLTSFLVTAVLLAGTIVSVSAAPISAVTFTGFGISANVANINVGWGFDVLSPVSVTDIGYYDLNANGLSGSHQVGLWTGSGTLLTTATVPAGTGATLADSFRYVMISPLILNPGSYVVGALNQATDTYVGLATGFVADPRISFTTGRFTFSPALVYPNGLDNMSPSIFGPNLRIDAPTAAVPEPASLSLLVAGLFGLAARRRTRRR